DPPAWFPSSDEVVFTIGPVGASRIVARRIDGSGGQRVLAFGQMGKVTPDGRHLVFLVEEGGARRLRHAPLGADGTGDAARNVFQGSEPPVGEFDLSPDGSALTYSVLEPDSRLNTFLTDFPAGSRQVQVTTRGGARPLFSSDGNALLYLTQALPETNPPRGALAKRPVAVTPLATAGPEEQILSEGREPPGVTILGFGFDTARDGRLLTLRRIDDGRGGSPRRLLVQNWRAVVGR